MKCRSFFLSFAALVFAASIAHAADATTYPIKITRPYKAGDAYDIHATFDGTDSSTTTLPGKPPEKEDHTYKVEFTARCDIQDVDAFGSEKNFTLTIQNATAGTDGKSVLEPGKIIECKLTDKELTATVRGGGDVPADVQKAIDFIYSPLNSSGVPDDDVLGSKVPRKVGESWPIDAAAAVKQAANSVTIDPKTVSGNSTLTGVETVNGIQAARLDSNMTFTNARPSTLPKEVTVNSSDFKITIGGLMPLDPALPPLEMAQSLHMHMVCTGPGDAPMKLDVSAHLNYKSTMTPVKK